VLIKVIIRYTNGKIKKGTTEDFFPNKDVFHLKDKDIGDFQKILINDLKAVFFVKDFEGNHQYQEKDDIVRVGLGRKINVNFKDGEKLVGYTQGFSRDRAGFIFFPSDPNSNNEKVFVVTAATDKVYFAS
jgi:hypothetical protein